MTALILVAETFCARANLVYWRMIASMGFYYDRLLAPKKLTGGSSGGYRWV